MSTKIHINKFLAKMSYKVLPPAGGATRKAEREIVLVFVFF